MSASDAPIVVTVPEAITLRGRYVQLEPLALEHVAELVEAASEDRSTYGYTHVPASEPEMVAMINAARRDQAAGWVVPFATRDRSTNRIVGSTRFLDLDYWRWPPPSH